MENRVYLIVYSAPAIIKGAYKVIASDGIEASDKVAKAIRGNYGDIKDSRSMVIEIPDGKIISID